MFLVLKSLKLLTSSLVGELAMSSLPTPCPGLGRRTITPRPTRDTPVSTPNTRVLVCLSMISWPLNWKSTNTLPITMLKKKKRWMSYLNRSAQKQGYGSNNNLIDKNYSFKAALKIPRIKKGNICTNRAYCPIS